MRCEQVRVELHSYVSGDVSPTLAESIKTHLGECQGCTREADAVRTIGAAVARGIKAWVDEGECPPGLAEQIQSIIHPDRPKLSRLAVWVTTSSLITAVAAGLFLLLLGTRPDLNDQMLGLPLVGALANRLNPPDFVQGKISLGSTDSLSQLSGTVRTFNRTFEQHGLTVTVHRVQLTPSHTQVQFSVQGLQNVKLLTTSLFEFILYGPDGPLLLHGFSGDIRSDKIMFKAYFDPIKSGFPRKFSMWVMPKVKNESLTWELGKDRRAPPVGPQASVVSWNHDGQTANVTVLWPVEYAYRVGGWKATDGLGNTYPVKEGLHATGSGAMIQQLLIEVPDHVVPVWLTASWVEYYERGPWEIPLSD